MCHLLQTLFHHLWDHLPANLSLHHPLLRSHQRQQDLQCSLQLCAQVPFHLQPGRQAPHCPLESKDPKKKNFNAKEIYLEIVFPY